MILRVIDAIIRTERSELWLPESITAIKSFSGQKVRHFLNAVCSASDTVFLEIGTWNGGTMAAAAFGNPGSFTTVDNFKDFGGAAGGTREKFREIGVNVRLIEADCWEVPMADLPRGVNVFFFDGPHDYESHRQALYHFDERLAPLFVHIVDDWEDKTVRDATFAGIEDADLRTLAYLWLGFGEHEARGGWWNGLGVFVLNKGGDR